MSKDCFEVAEYFWTSQKKYPEYPYLKERRLFEIQFILNNIDIQTQSILDAGCGDGSTLLLIRELTYIKNLHGYDLSEHLIQMAKRKLGDSAQLHTINFNFSHRLPQTDITLSLGVLPYLFSVESIQNYLSLINSRTLIVRTPCDLTQTTEINKYSEDLKNQYAAKYRTPDEIEALLAQKFVVEKAVRAYPDAIESKFGTKHFFFVCRTKPL